MIKDIGGCTISDVIGLQLGRHDADGGMSHLDDDLLPLLDSPLFDQFFG
jgi:hypothetical protein